MDASKVKKKIENKRIRDIIWKIDHHKVVDDDEWIQFAREMEDYVKTDIPEEVKRLFYPLGYLERTTIIVDGITRWRNSACYKCKRKMGKYQCEIYPGNKNSAGGIPNEIWAGKETECPYFE